MTIWEKLLEILGSLLSPDWNTLILLIPVLLLVPVVGYLLWVVRRYATAGPQISRPLPTPPAPTGIHMPGPSLAPFLAAGGAFAFLLATLFIKIVPATDPETGKPIPDSSTVVIEPFGVLALVVGLVAIVGALLYWGREANREYDALEGAAADRAAALPADASGAASIGDGSATSAGAPVVDGPPAGVHVPGPSFRPLLASIADGGHAARPRHRPRRVHRRPPHDGHRPGRLAGGRAEGVPRGREGRRDRPPREHPRAALPHRHAHRLRGALRGVAAHRRRDHPAAGRRPGGGGARLAGTRVVGSGATPAPSGAPTAAPSTAATAGRWSRSR